MTNWKFHSIAVLTICAIITGVYLLIAPAPQPEETPTPQKGDRQIEIVSATWGEDCNSAIEQALLEREQAPAARDAQGNLIKQTPLAKVTADNALEPLARRCNHQFTCALRATAETLGGDPLPSCFKKLVVSHRCFSFDKLTVQTIPQGSPLKIDCRAPAK